MTYYIDLKYINIISTSLERFSWKKQDMATCRCSICGDSKKNKLKTRFYFYQSKGTFYVKCHNCGYTSSFQNYLEFTNNPILQEYRMEKFKDKYGSKKQEEVVLNTVTDFSVVHLDQFPTIVSLPTDHYAKQYCLNRKLPIRILNELRFTEDFATVANLFEEGNYTSDARIIIPFKDVDGKLFAVQGRSLDKNSKIRYLTARFKNDSTPKIYGLNKVNPAERNYCFEGPFDSMFIPNSFAMAGAGLQISQIPIDTSQTVFVYDNEPRNTNILRFMQDIIKGNRQICIWPKTILQKDINDMVLAGIDPISVINTNTFVGLGAQLKFNDWRSI